MIKLLRIIPGVFFSIATFFLGFPNYRSDSNQVVEIHWQVFAIALIFSTISSFLIFQSTSHRLVFLCILFGVFLLMYFLKWYFNFWL